jgi:hypothetical protein
VCAHGISAGSAWPSNSRVTSRCWPLLRASNFPLSTAGLLDTKNWRKR